MHAKYSIDHEVITKSSFMVDGVLGQMWHCRKYCKVIAKSSLIANGVFPDTIGNYQYTN